MTPESDRINPTRNTCTKSRMPSSLLQQGVRFLLTGGMATFSHYMVLAVCMELFGWSAAVASAAGYLVGSVLSYIINYHFTFASDRSHKQAAPRFYMVVAVGWSINTLIMTVLTGTLDWNPWLSQLIATLGTLVWNFMAARFWVFRMN